MTDGRPAAMVDLARERRVRANLAELRALRDANPDLADRLDGALAGELECPGLEDDLMADKGTEPAATSLRVEADVLARADALVPLLAADPFWRTAGRKPSRSTILRMAVLRGLDSLEAEYRPAKKGRSR